MAHIQLCQELKHLRRRAGWQFECAAGLSFQDIGFRAGFRCLGLEGLGFKGLGFRVPTIILGA